ncbi:outer membrane receptor [Acetobacter indonesiensis NRIC 0313]|uniref:Amino acid ABC transporter substrate-binding protein n=1 Tax=Acetobacter indonesiensis TaxID=104101 RepID=A0A6N3T2N3_9PROT|nr:TonB-dependent siderophore receptor [Acetobacter indonesiensis]GBQ54759.1 outer membrane receptor [Acetobacter indonesiensis NRIC 0313]GEN02298.1 amino acid ABC transporter substrate-binding protein [Acetobacter indonesiensis]
MQIEGTVRVKQTAGRVKAQEKSRLTAGALCRYGVFLWSVTAGLPVVAAQAADTDDAAKKKPQQHQASQTKTDKSAPENDVPDSVESLVVQGERHKNATTDGTGSYVVKAVSMSKMLMRLDEIPQSVSVLSRQQMRDQNLNTVDDALKQVPGINVNLYGDGTAGITSRGYAVTPQFDGVPSTGGLQMSQQFDVAIYDRLEVLRGPNGMFQGSAPPGGSVNFVRKRPLDHFKAQGSFSGGSWNNFHADADVTGPLTASKRVTGRFVLAGTDRDYFYQNAHDRRWTAYADIDVHITDHTTLSLMAIGQKNDTTRFMGLPRAANGADLHLSRNSFVGADWGQTSSPMYELGGELEHRFGGGWRVRLSGRHRVTDTSMHYAYLNSYTAAQKKGNFVVAKSLIRDVYDGADLYFTGPVHLLNRKHDLLIGANYDSDVMTDGGATVNSRTNTSLAGLDIFAPVISSTIEPTITTMYREPTQQAGIYGSARIQILKSLDLMLGGRLSFYEYKYRNLSTNGSYVVSQKNNAVPTPYLGLVWHFVPNIAAYVSFTDTFTPQSAYSLSGRLKPVLGQQIEGGLKGDFFNRKLNVTLAGYRVIERNKAIEDGDLEPICGRSHTSTCYRAAGKVRSQGAEIEMIGRLLPGWDINASYTYNDNVILKNSDASLVGQAYTPNFPKHLFKLWTHYRFAAPEVTRNVWSVGGGVTAQSGTFGTTRTVTQGSYVVASAQVGYQLRPELNITVNVNNLSNTRYYQRLGNVNYYNYYGEPRNFMATVQSVF